MLDLKLNGTSIFANTLTTTRIGNSVNNLFVNHDASSSVVEFRAGGAIFTKIINGYLRLGSVNGISWSANPFNNVESNLDIALVRDSAGVLKITDGSTGTGYIKQDPVAIASLPTAATVGAGTRGFVNDASSTTFAAEVAVGTNDGGSTVVPVYCDGSTWRIG